MKSIVALCFLAVVAAAYARPGDKYTDKYDTIDLKEIIKNRRLLIPYLKCILEQGKCSPEGKELKGHISDALENECNKCTEAQRNGTRTVIGHLINHEQDYWTQLTAKYDPDNKFSTKYEKELKTVAPSA